MPEIRERGAAKDMDHEPLMPYTNKQDLFGYRVKCTGRDKNGYTCRKLLFTGIIEDVYIRCPKCGQMQRVMRLP